VGISPIFNVADLYPYREDEIGESYDQKENKWEKQMPVEEKLHMEKIIDQRIDKRTRRKTYFEYLMKWKGFPEQYASSVSEADIFKKENAFQELMDSSS
jgi:hypothetical protein